jgi:hypothetical protein
MGVKTQRGVYCKYQKAKEAGTLGQEKKEYYIQLKKRIEQLEKIGFVFSVGIGRNENSWNQHLAELKVYKKEHGDCLVPTTYPPNPKLGYWVSNQRGVYWKYQEAKEAGTLAHDKKEYYLQLKKCIEQLEKIGFVWSVKVEETKQLKD